MIKKGINIIINVLTVLVLLVLSLIIIAKVNMIISGSNHFSVLDYSLFKVVTGSMKPAILENDIVLVKKKSNYKEQDIITYKSGDSFITHRIIQENNGNFIVKGDHNNAPDKETIKQDIIIGKVVIILKGLGIWQEILTKPYILAMIFITLLAFDFAFSYKGDKERKEHIKDIDMDSLKKAQVASNNRLSDEEIRILYEKLEQIKKEEENPKLERKEKEFLDYTIGYTIRLDVDRVRQEISNKLEKK